jgi:hypothetical protein
VLTLGVLLLVSGAITYVLADHAHRRREGGDKRAQVGTTDGADAGMLDGTMPPDCGDGGGDGGRCD